ncbi:hypothetical protein AVEN_240010-1, partial [Araneus ventricosus]
MLWFVPRQETDAIGPSQRVAIVTDGIPCAQIEADVFYQQVGLQAIPSAEHT